MTGGSMAGGGAADGLAGGAAGDGSASAFPAGARVGARAEVLARIRQANAVAARDPGAPPAPSGGGPGYRTVGQRDRADLLDLLSDRLTDYKATVRRTSAAGLAAEIAAALGERGARRVVVAAGLGSAVLDPAVLARTDVETVTDGGPGGVTLSPAELDGLDGTVTGAAVAIAETGTIVLDGSPGQGRRAISLVPDYHLCVVRASQVVELVPEAVARLANAATRPLTWISGPSATSDIELERVEGVHGPRTLVVVLVQNA
ncbi:MAG TPA: LUD domain-containing protein [Streptosporangiaceae bacterium]|jgi:L-lactate dehydrogenase complex protein LldG